MEKYFYKGHQISKGRIFWQTQHGQILCRSCTRPGIEKLIDDLTGCRDEKQNALYHLERAAQILERNLSDPSAIDEENEVLVFVRKNIAKLSKLMLK